MEHPRDMIRSQTAWDENPLNPLRPPAIRNRSEWQLHQMNRQAIARMPRNMLGIALLMAAGAPLPAPPRAPVMEPQRPMPTAEDIRKSAEAMHAMRLELADPGAERVEELNNSVAYAEAQTTFEAHMKASTLRETLKA